MQREEAIQLAQLALKQQPNSPEALQANIKIFSKINIQKARNLIDEATSKAPKNIELMEEIALFYLEEDEQHYTALEYFHTLSELNPLNSEYVTHQANIYDKINEEQETIVPLYLKAIEIDPQNVFSLGQYAEYLLEKGKYKEALEFFQIIDKTKAIEPSYQLG